MTASVTVAVDLRRTTLIGALHDELRGVINIAKITSIVDRAMVISGITESLETVLAADAAVAAYAVALPVPPPAVVAAVGGYQTLGEDFNVRFGDEFVVQP